MIRLRTLFILSSGLCLSSPALYAQDLDRYRDVQLGSGLATVAIVNGLAPEDATVIHRRPAALHDLAWRSRLFLSDSGTAGDPVRDVTFSFYNDQLFRIVVNYDRQRMEGLTDADLIEGVGAIYGSPMARTAARPRASEEVRDLDQGTVIARWESAETSVTLLRARYPSPVSLVVLSKRLDTLARSATAEAMRLDRVEGPQRELDRTNREAEAVRMAEEKARPSNKAAFKP